METQALTVMSNGQNIEPILSPKEQVEKASEMAKVLQQVVQQADLSRNFGGRKEHLEYEAWQTIGQFFNCTPQTEWTKSIKDGDKIIGYEARVNIVNSIGRIIATAESMCLRDEPNWKSKPLYALRSMAQTRTAGKAFRSVFAWVAVLAGYSATPADEMLDNFQKSPSKEREESGISKKQKGLLHIKMKEAGLSKDEQKTFFSWMAPKTTKEASVCIDQFDTKLAQWRDSQKGGGNHVSGKRSGRQVPEDMTSPSPNGENKEPDPSDLDETSPSGASEGFGSPFNEKDDPGASEEAQEPIPWEDSYGGLSPAMLYDDKTWVREINTFEGILGDDEVNIAELMNTKSKDRYPVYQALKAKVDERNAGGN